MPISRHVLPILVFPTMVTVVVPLLLTLWAGPSSTPLVGPLPAIALTVGLALVAAGLFLISWTVGLFHRRGRGTLAPFDPPEQLVVHGPYRHVRNPMISGVLGVLLGESIALLSPVLLAWFVVFFALNALLFPLWEEPQLTRRFGSEYEEYCRNVPRWLPRRHPWQPAGQGLRVESGE